MWCILSSTWDQAVTSLFAAPSVPLNLTFHSGGVQNDSITLNWLRPRYPNGNVFFYQLKFSSSNGDFFLNTTDNTTTTVLSDLTPGTQYTFSVRAFTVDFGPFSAPLIIETADGKSTGRTIEKGDRRELWYNMRVSSCSIGIE